MYTRVLIKSVTFEFSAQKNVTSGEYNRKSHVFISILIHTIDQKKFIVRGKFSNKFLYKNCIYFMLVYLVSILY